MSVLQQLSTCSPTYSVLTAKDGGIVLDVEHDRILKLNPTGAEIWTLLQARESELQIVLKISERYGINQECVAKDVRNLLRKLAELGIAPRTLELGNAVQVDQTDLSKKFNVPSSFPWYGQSGSETAPGPTRTTVFTALIGLAVFDIVLSLFSLKSLCFLVKKWPIRARRSSDPDSIGKVCKGVETGCIWYPRKALCLQRSAVTTCLLRSLGIPGRLTIGVRAMPVLAHAWVEVEDVVVNDWPRVKDFYHSLVSY